MRTVTEPIEKLPTGIPGLDLIAEGGLPKCRSTLIAGTSGSAKTVLAVQFLAEGLLKSGENGIFVTFEESAADIRRNMIGLGWDVAKWEREGKWAFLDLSPQPGEEEHTVSGKYDFGGFLAGLEDLILQLGAKRVALDSVSGVFSQFDDPKKVRNQLLWIGARLKKLEVTCVMTAERTEEWGSVSRYGVEEFVADNVIILRNVIEEEKCRRTIQILKFRGTNHQKGLYPFTIIPGEGIQVIPLSEIELEQRSSEMRITSGSADLDAMCGGGFFRDSIVLVSGATGCGKTLMVTEFVAGGAMRGERCLLFAFEESRDQLFRNAKGWGVDFEQMERDGTLRVVSGYPEAQGLEDHLVRMRKVIDEFRPNRLAVDSLSALERISTIKGFREFVIGVTSFIKDREVAALFTSTTPSLMGGTSITEAHISTITDSIILLRYVEILGGMRRGLTVLKMRGSKHDKDIHEFTIDDEGMHVGSPFRNVTGIISGHPMHVSQSEMDRITGLFGDDPTM